MKKTDPSHLSGLALIIRHDRFESSLLYLSHLIPFFFSSSSFPIFFFFLFVVLFIPNNHCVQLYRNEWLEIVSVDGRAKLCTWKNHRKDLCAKKAKGGKGEGDR